MARINPIVISADDTVEIVSPGRDTLEISSVIIEGNPYTGDYVVTPTQSTQVLPTAHLSMSDNVTINPIPSNYGLITWDGSVLTVS